MNRKGVKKLINCTISLIVVLSLSGCYYREGVKEGITSNLEQVVNSKQTELTTLTLPYTYNDTFNPYTATSINNLSVIPLIFDSLVKINPSYKINYKISESCESQNTVFKFTLKEGVKFSDGSELTASDVVYSFNKAKEKGHYSQQLSNLKKISGSSRLVTIELNSPNNNFLYLADVPIVKYKTAENNMQPIGSGRYVLGQEGSGKVLNINKTYFEKQNYKFNKINLTYSPSTNTTEMGIKASTLNVAYRGTLDKTMSGTGTTSIEMSLAHLVYLGFNSKTPLFSNKEFRKAINAAIDEKNFLTTVYSDKGITSPTPIYPKVFEDVNYNRSFKGIDKAEKLLNNLGYTQRDQYQNRKNSTSPLEFELLIPEDSSYKLTAAEHIKSRLKRCGIIVNIVKVNQNSYLSRIETSNFTSYIGETIEQNDGSLSPFLPGGALSAGIEFSHDLQNLYNSLLNNNATYKEFVDEFIEQSPIVPLCFRNASVVKSTTLKSNITPSVSDVFYNINEW